MSGKPQATRQASRPVELTFAGVEIPLEPAIKATAQPKSTAKKRRLYSGDLCPNCGKEHLDYDGLLNLTCPQCGIITGGCFT